MAAEGPGWKAAAHADDRDPVAEVAEAFKALARGDETLARGDETLARDTIAALLRGRPDLRDAPADDEDLERLIE